MTREAFKRAIDIDNERYNIGHMREKLESIEKHEKSIGFVGSAHDQAVFAKKGFRDYLLQAIKQALGEYEAQLTKEFEEL